MAFAGFICLWFIWGGHAGRWCGIVRGACWVYNLERQKGPLKSPFSGFMVYGYVQYIADSTGGPASSFDIFPDMSGQC